MDRSGLIENFDDGFFCDEEGNRFMLSEFDGESYISISHDGSVWTSIYSGRSAVMDWREASHISAELRTALQQICKDKYKQKSASTVHKIFYMTKHLSTAMGAWGLCQLNDFSQLNSSKIIQLWDYFNTSTRSTFRECYSILAKHDQCGASKDIARMMRGWKARNGIVHLRDVVMWNPTRGAFTTGEWEIVRRELERDGSSDNDVDAAAKIIGRSLLETLKRPSQIAKVSAASGLLKIPGDAPGAPTQYFLKIPKAKGQTGAEPGLWQITSALGKAIEEYSKRPEIQRLQREHNRLFVIPGSQTGDLAWTEFGQVSSGSIRNLFKSFFNNIGVLSPRTGEVIIVTPTRIRHTGATALALQGFSRDEIQEILEHDSPYTADAYIEAVGSDLMPALQRATDRGLGKVFEVLSDSYFFRGKIVDQAGDNPIVIPVVEISDPNETPKAPAVVGSCGKSGSCSLHPFWACYSGCEHFLAWREADHAKSLSYVESEFARWGAAEGGKKRTKLFKDFDRVAAGIKEVVSLTTGKGEHPNASE